MTQRPSPEAVIAKLGGPSQRGGVRLSMVEARLVLDLLSARGWAVQSHVRQGRRRLTPEERDVLRRLIDERKREVAHKTRRVEYELARIAQPDASLSDVLLREAA